MTNSKLILSASETMAILMRSMGSYVYYRITTKQGREAYRLSMKECIIQVTSDFESLDMIRARVEGHRAEALHLYPKKLFDIKGEERRCHIYAIDHALDIIGSIEARFITGQCDSEMRRYNNKKWICYENKDLFR